MDARVRVTPRLVWEERQPPQPAVDDQQVLVDHDLKYLLRYLEQSRYRDYRIVSRPDQELRNEVAPDYLVEEVGSGRRIAVEHSQLMNQDMQAGIARGLKQGHELIMISGKIDPGRVATLALDAINRKISKGQLIKASANERVLLLRNRLRASRNSFLRINDWGMIDPKGIDHAYLLAGSNLIELW